MAGKKPLTVAKPLTAAQIKAAQKEWDKRLTRMSLSMERGRLYNTSGDDVLQWGLDTTYGVTSDGSAFVNPIPLNSGRRVKGDPLKQRIANETGEE